MVNKKEFYSNYDVSFNKNIKERNLKFFDESLSKIIIKELKSTLCEIGESTIIGIKKESLKNLNEVIDFLTLEDDDYIKKNEETEIFKYLDSKNNTRNNFLDILNKFKAKVHNSISKRNTMYFENSTKDNFPKLRILTISKNSNETKFYINELENKISSLNSIKLTDESFENNLGKFIILMQKIEEIIFYLYIILELQNRIINKNKTINILEKGTLDAYEVYGDFLKNVLVDYKKLSLGVIKERIKNLISNDEYEKLTLYIDKRNYFVHECVKTININEKQLQKEIYEFSCSIKNYVFDFINYKLNDVKQPLNIMMSGNYTLENKN